MNSLQPSTVFNVWRFNVPVGTYELLDTTDYELEIDFPFERMRKINSGMAAITLLQLVGKYLDKKVQAEAFTIVGLRSNGNGSYTATVDTFRRERWYNKIYNYFKRLRGETKWN